MAWIGDMMMEGLANGIDETASEVLSSANEMVNNLNNVFDGLSADMSEIPTDFNVSSAANSHTLTRNPIKNKITHANTTPFLFAKLPAVSIISSVKLVMSSFE